VITLPKRILVVDDDPGIRGLLGTALVPPEFSVHAYADARAALADLPSVRPDLIVCDITMPEMDGRAFLAEVRRSAAMEDVAFVFLSAVQDDDEILASFGNGADDFVTKPFHVLRFVAKVRATLRLAERRRPDTVTGEVGAAGTLPLLRYCEETRLTGRLTVTRGAASYWADFLGGDLTGSGAGPEPTGDAFDALLAMSAGSFVVEQRPLDASALRASVDRLAEPPAPPMRGATPAIPTGRLSRVDIRGDAVEVQTEGDNQPDFRVTTVVARRGQVLRKIESGWPHPLGRREDQALARAQIDRQHERVLAMLNGLASGAPASAEQVVEPSVLAFAVSFVADQVRVHLGGVMVATLLRRTHRATASRYPVLRTFRVAEEGRVAAETSADPLPRAADLVGASAAWTADFLAAAGEIVEKARSVSVRRVTRMLESELQSCGFYAALDGALDQGIRNK